MITFQIPRPDDFQLIAKLVQWAGAQDIAMVMTGHGWNHGYQSLAAIGCLHASDRAHVLDILSFQEKHADKDVFLHLNYDVKNDLEDLHSSNKDDIDFPHAFAFVPRITLAVSEENLVFHCWDEHLDEQAIQALSDDITNTSLDSADLLAGPMVQAVSDEQYLRDIKTLQKHIQRGDVYQANYCQSFTWPNTRMNGAALYNEGNKLFPNPFSAYYKLEGHQLLGFSPERFMGIEGSRIYSQPMKGTAPRGANKAKDEALKHNLSLSEKDRRENVMIVDMVRNDLSHYAEKGSVCVPELYKIETYPRVHQMFSTVEAKLNPEASKIAAFIKAFPMGSMTGAPKIRAMQLLDALEHTKRGIYSGSVAYFRFDGTVDSNVIIRSLVYHEPSGVLSAMVGGGITALSDPKAELEECRVKLAPLIDLIDQNRSANIKEPLPLDDARPVH